LSERFWRTTQASSDSRDDPEIPFEHLERYSRPLPHAIVRALDGRGHEFNQPEFPELANDIRRLTPQRHQGRETA